MSSVQILSVRIDRVTMAEALQRCLAFVDGDVPRLVVTPNAEITYAAGKDPELAAAIQEADLVIPDGVGVVWASKILGSPVPEKVAGIDLTTALLEALSRRGRGRVYLLGTRPEVVAEAARRLQERFPGIQVVGYHDGFFGPDEEARIVQAVAETRPDVLVVGMGCPRQEKFLARNRSRLGAKVSIGAGGTIDGWAGVSPRAPEWAVKANVEWLYRILKLGRVSRSLPPLLKFGFAVVARRLRGG